MPLQKQIVPLPLIKGVEKGVANVLRPPDSLEQGSNIEQLVTGELTKRKGFQSVDTTLTTGSALFPAGSSVGVLESQTVNQILMSDGSLDILYDYGEFEPVIGELSINTEPLIGDVSSIQSYDMAIVSDVLYAAIVGNSSPSGRLYRFDRNLNVIQYGNANYYGVGAAGAYGHRFRFAGSSLFSNNGGNVGVFSLAGATLSASLFTPAGTGLWDAIPWSNGGFAFVVDDGANILIRLVNSSYATIGSATVSRTNVNTLTIWEEIAGLSFFVGVTRTAGASASTYRLDSTCTVVQTRDYSAGAYYYGCTGITTGNNTVFFFLEAGSSTSSETKERGLVSTSFTGQSTGTSTGLTNPPIIKRRSGLGSRPFKMSYSDDVFLMITHMSEDTNNLQNCYFLWQVGDKIHTQLNYGKANNYISTFSANEGQYSLPSIPSFADGSFCAGLFSRLESTFNLTGANSTYGLNIANVSKPSLFPGSKPVAFGPNTYLSGNGIYTYDGGQITEYGFYLYPDPVSSTTNSGAGNVVDGAYQYVVVYEYYDRNGNLLESAPSQVYSVTYAAGSNRTYTINLNDVGFCSKSEMRVTLYRTAASGTVFYYVNSTDNFTSTTLSIVDNVADGQLTSGKILYTTGGIVENIIPPNSNFICQAKNRLWTFETGSTDTIWFSKEIRTGFMPAFSDLLVQKIASAGGELVALAQIDDKLIVFKEFSVFALLGDGPSDSLVGAFSIPVQITSGMGCISARSVIETPIGIFYQSQEGIYLIDRSLQNQFIGKPLYKSEGTIRSSVYDPVLNRIIFLTTTEMWVYYITTNSWYSWTCTNPVDLTLVNGVLYYLSTTKLLKQGTTYQDDGANYAQTVKLGQFAFAGVQGYQRIYRALLTGRKTTDADTTNLTLKVYVNSNTSVTDTFTLPHTTAISGNRFELEIRPSVQRCETMEIEITQTASTSGFIISAATAEVGALTGAARRGEARRAT